MFSEVTQKLPTSLLIHVKAELAEMCFIVVGGLFVFWSDSLFSATILAGPRKQKGMLG